MARDCRIPFQTVCLPDILVSLTQLRSMMCTPNLCTFTASNVSGKLSSSFSIQADPAGEGRKSTILIFCSEIMAAGNLPCYVRLPLRYSRPLSLSLVSCHTDWFAAQALISLPSTQHY